MRHRLPARGHRPRRAGRERGDGRFEEVTWGAALDDIAERLRRVVDEHGPEAFAVSTSNWNTSVENGMGRRFMNLLGSPNWISGVTTCTANTAAVNKLTLGWFPWPDLLNTDLVVLGGHNPRKHSWTPIYNLIRQAQAKGGKLMDPARPAQPGPDRRARAVHDPGRPAGRLADVLHVPDFVPAIPT